MLQRAENVSISFARHLFSKGHVRLKIGRSFANFNKLRLTQDEFATFLQQRITKPFRFIVGSTSYWLFEDKFYKDSDGLDADAVKAFILTKKRLQHQRIDRAKTISSLLSEPVKTQRGVIPDDIKLFVWERDHGQCAKCGSNVELQYDHIIPFSLGGATTPENLQILCGRCNRLKSASIV